MTCCFCDRCGKQVKKDSYSAGKYSIQKTEVITHEITDDGFAVEYQKITRYMNFCDECSKAIEKILDELMGDIGLLVK